MVLLWQLGFIVLDFVGYGRTFAAEGLSYSAKYSSFCTVTPEPKMLARLWPPEAPPHTAYGPLSSQFLYRALRFPSTCVPIYETPDSVTFATNADPMQGDVILATDSNHRFLLAGTQSLLPQCNKCLNVIGNYAELWCVPSATYVSCIHGSQNDVLGIRESDTWPPPPKVSNYIYIFFFSDNHRNHFSKDILSTDSRFTHISAIKADTNTLSQSPCKAGPHSTTMTMSQNITSPVFTKRPANYITQKAKINDSGNNL